jgi:ADP-ribosyl-[dinitrogen reductase] hydrolase
MIGGGPFCLDAGQWTDDTSMALCLAASLAETGRFDLRDQIDRYCRWQDEGYMSCTGRCFDIGMTVRRALNRYRETGNPIAGSTHPKSAGNGCIMRLAPVAIFFAGDEDAAARHAGESATTTHGAAECVGVTSLFGRYLTRAIAGGDKTAMLAPRATRDDQPASISAIEDAVYRTKAIDHIRGSGYVVDCLVACPR